jgi:multidrug efflux pump subunit AcrA (membrane-fusion protein)
MMVSSLVMALTLAWAAPPTLSAESADDPVADDCVLASIEDQEVPGADPGVLVKMIAKEGMKVEKDKEVARVDDRESQAQLVVKRLEYEVAQQEADSQVEIVFAKASADVQKTAYEKIKLVNEGVKKAVTEIDVLRAKLEWEKAEAGVAKAKESNVSDKLKAQAKKAEVDAAQVSVNHRVIRAPFDGVVVKVGKHVGEWVSPGDPIVQIVRIDRLRATGNLKATDWGPVEIEGRNVTVEVKLPRGQTAKVSGKIVYASPVVVSGQLPIIAEIDTPLDQNGRPLVHAGLEASMTIHVSQPVSPETRQATPRKPPDKVLRKS